MSKTPKPTPQAIVDEERSPYAAFVRFSPSEADAIDDALEEGQTRANWIRLMVRKHFRLPEPIDGRTAEARNSRAAAGRARKRG